MTLPASLHRRIEERFGPIHAIHPVGGGCISPAVRISFAAGEAFLKYGDTAPPGFFRTEARGLEALRSVSVDADAALRVPEVLGVADAAGDENRGDPSWLLLEWLGPGRRGSPFDERLGRGLARLHGSIEEGEGDPWLWGWEADGFIGSLPQANGSLDDWPEFWRIRRLEPQLRLARDAGRMPGTAAEWGRLFARLPGLLAPAELDGPSLLHGDLWDGNVLAVRAGNGGDAEPALIDPSVYLGHREVDLAMAALFGGFGPEFHAAYEEVWPLVAGWEVRRPVYQLYYLLVHVNLFGGGYDARTARTLRDALRA